VDDDGFRTALAEINPALFIQSALPRPQLGFADGLQVIVRIMLLGLLRLDLLAQVCWGFL